MITGLPRKKKRGGVYDKCHRVYLQSCNQASFASKNLKRFPIKSTRRLQPVCPAKHGRSAFLSRELVSRFLRQAAATSTLPRRPLLRAAVSTTRATLLWVTCLKTSLAARAKECVGARPQVAAFGTVDGTLVSGSAVYVGPPSAS